MMKTTYTILLLLLTTLTMYSQVGINTIDPSESSILDIYSDDKGVLLPRVALTGTTDTSTIASPIESLLVYNTATSNDVVPGFYFWNGTEWTGFGGSSTGGSDGWDLSGNSLSSGEFLGTTNYSSLEFKVNSKSVGLFHPNGGINIGLNSRANSNSSIALGVGADASSSNEATAVGPGAVASSFQSAAFGYKAQASTSNSSLALGHSSLASGYRSVAVGYNSKATSNNNALALGSDSASSGQNSSALGASSNASGQNSTAIGYNAKTSQSNAIVLGDTNSATVGIGTSTPNNTTKIDVSGKYKLGENGSVQKNLISFDANPSIRFENAVPGASQIIQITIPSGTRPTSTKATVVVTPTNDFTDEFSISWAKMSNTSTLRVKIVNSSLNTASVYSGHFYVTIQEF